MTLLLGAHTSIAGGVDKAIERAERIGCTAIQIFTKNSNQWKSSLIDENIVQTYKNLLSKSNIKIVISHDSYLINLAAKEKPLLEKSRQSFIEELQRCEQLGIEYLNFHPGAHTGAGEEEGIKTIAESINIALEKTRGYKVKAMLETTAGQGTSIGYRFEQLKKIIDLIEDKNRTAVCIDTCHIFAAGYDIRTAESCKKVFREFDEVIGLEYLKAFHLNDCKKELGSRVDRHEHIGKGFIGLEGFRYIMNEKKFNKIPKVLETPKGAEMLEDVENMNILKGLIKNKK